MDKNSSPYFTHLKCRECGRPYPKLAVHVCDYDFGPLEAAYDYAAIKAAISRDILRSRHRRMWRYRELLPIDGDPTIGCRSGSLPSSAPNTSRKNSASRPFSSRTTR